MFAESYSSGCSQLILLTGDDDWPWRQLQSVLAPDLRYLAGCGEQSGSSGTQRCPVNELGLCRDVSMKEPNDPQQNF